MSAALARTAAVAAIGLTAALALAQTRTVPPPSRPAIQNAVLGNEARTPEVSTAELREILFRRSALVLDVRPYAEYARGHIPGAQGLYVPDESSRAPSELVRVRRFTGGRKDSALVLYGNGPTLDLRLADTLASEGYTRVARYALGIAMWRALGGVTEIEDQGLRRIAEYEEDAVWVDGRDSIRWAARTIRGAINIPRVRVATVRDSLDVSSLRLVRDRPAYDYDTRIVVFGADSTEARAVAEGLARQAFRNVSFYGGTFLEALVASGR